MARRKDMTRALALGSAAAVAAISLLLVATASAAPKTVVGSVGPGFTISLKLDGKKVAKLKAGVPYRFTVTDRSSGHDFHLTGPGVNKVVTGVGFTGTKSVILKLKKGTYSFVCDPHSSSMRGSFKVA
jgi:plastocyanin